MPLDPTTLTLLSGLSGLAGAIVSALLGRVLRRMGATRLTLVFARAMTALWLLPALLGAALGFVVGTLAQP